MALEDADGEAPQARHVFRFMPGSNAGAVFVEVSIEQVMMAFDGPVSAVGGKHAPGIGLAGRPANGKQDCAGVIMKIGSKVTNFVHFHPSGSLFLLCADESLDACIGPFRRIQGQDA